MAAAQMVALMAAYLVVGLTVAALEAKATSLESMVVVVASVAEGAAMLEAAQADRAAMDAGSP